MFHAYDSFRVKYFVFSTAFVAPPNTASIREPFHSTTFRVILTSQFTSSNTAGFIIVAIMFPSYIIHFAAMLVATSVAVISIDIYQKVFLKEFL